MVDADTVFTTFVQDGNSCTLASYAVASHHFTERGPYEFFCDYCKHFKIPATSDQDAEREYNNDFHPRYSRPNCSGYKIIRELHNNSPETCFVESRGKFHVEYIHQTTQRLEEIEDRLQHEEALISVAFRMPSGDVHSCCVGFDKRGFYMIETSSAARKKGIVLIPGIRCLGDLQDSLLMFAHSATKKSSGGNHGLRKN